jgi:hypothetical protein
VRTLPAAPSADARLPVPGEVLTHRAVTAITASIVALTFVFSLGNVARLCLDLGISAWVAWLVGPAVDLSVVGLLTGMRFLSLHGYTDVQLSKLRRMLRFCGVLTLALNTAGALGHRQFGTALVDAVGPALLIGWSGGILDAPSDLRGLLATCVGTTRTSGRDRSDPGTPCRPARSRAGTRRRAPRGDRQAYLAGHSSLTAADRARSGERHRPVVRAEVAAEVKGGQLRAA